MTTVAEIMEEINERETTISAIRNLRNAMVEVWLKPQLTLVETAFLSVRPEGTFKLNMPNISGDSIWPWERSVQCTITLSVSLQVAAWGDLTPIFKALEHHCGLHVENWQSQDDAASYTRIYYNHWIEKEKGKVSLHIFANLPGDTETCKRVIVGWSDPGEAYVPKPQPIYKMVCSDAQEEEARAVVAQSDRDQELL